MIWGRLFHRTLQSNVSRWFRRLRLTANSVMHSRVRSLGAHTRNACLVFQHIPCKVHHKESTTKADFYRRRIRSRNPLNSDQLDCPEISFKSTPCRVQCYLLKRITHTQLLWGLSPKLTHSPSPWSLHPMSTHPIQPTLLHKRFPCAVWHCNSNKNTVAKSKNERNTVLIVRCVDL